MSKCGLNDYPGNWKEIATAVKAGAGWCCARCGHLHEPQSGYTLTVHHLDLDKSNNRWWNLLPLCQRCHLSIQSRVDLRQAWMFEHSDWFKPYVAGWYAWAYLGEDLNRDEVEQRMEVLLGLERVS